MLIASGVEITGIATSVPMGIDQLSSHEDEWGTSNIEKFTKLTGVKNRYLSSLTKSKRLITASDLCYDAAERLIKFLKIDRDSIDAIIFVSQYPLRWLRLGG